ncbi:MAG: hypothetical protein JSV95_09090 [Gemmatimonadota bacterium]|jgi:hypothetical protein|nr:MAG: hypothetical protein JSV95_09090 [Gemmatimonadota bacterium]
MTMFRTWPPLVSEASLYSYLVTRTTGRAVRLSIEEQVARHEGEVLTVLDFRNVAVIDYSCADEVVAELAYTALGSGSELVGQRGEDRESDEMRAPSASPTQPAPARRFVAIRGLEDHHWDPIDSALRRRNLAVAAERADGELVLVGSVEQPEEHLWRLVCEHEQVDPEPLAGELGLSEPEARSRLEALHRRRLVLRQEDTYVSFRRVLCQSMEGPSAPRQATPDETRGEDG